MTKYIIGLMSGSSLDGLDIALCKFQYSDKPRKGQVKWEILKATTTPYNSEWQSRLRKTPKMSAIDLAETDTALGKLFGEIVLDFLEDIDIEVELVASHGHTVFHFPEKGFTTQLGHGAHLAAKCKLPVIYDIRMADIANGGQGAPLAPVVDEWLFPDYNFFLNLGGIANISCQTTEGFVGYDIFGANQTLNALANEINLPFDENGQLASQGTINPSLKKQLEENDFLKQNYPKSLDNQWVINNITKPVLAFDDTIPNKLATVVEVTAQAIGNEIKKLIPLTNTTHNQILITGGGAHNQFLVDRIKNYSPKNLQIILPPNLIINNKESLLVALMGLLNINNIPNSNPTVTGASQNSIGGIYVSV